MPIKYVPFIPEPIEGQAVLGNFNRVLKYKGADDVSMSLQRGMPLYELSKQESVGNDSSNMLIRGECVSACAYLKEQGIEVDLVYIDPPFASGADYAKKVYVRRNPKVAETIKQAEKKLDLEDLKAFEEKMYGDVWDKEKYLSWMYENLMAIKGVMSKNASIFVHLDWHIGHYVKILLDEIFGEDKFKNEIVWCYSIGGKSNKCFGRKHDVIFWYCRSEDYYFDGKNKFVVTKRKQNTHMKTSIDEEGREYQEKIDKKSGKAYRYYVDEGKMPEDYWIDIEQLNREDAEREEYATQKPEKLLERIIAASTDKQMIVADFFGGSGVTSAVAHKLGRKFIHCDIGVNSIQTTRDRLVKEGASFDILDIKDGVQLFRNPVQTMEKLKMLIPGLKNEDSLNSFWAGAITDSKLGMIPVYVPNLVDSSTKLLDTVMMNRIIHQEIPELSSNVRKVIIYYVDIFDETEIRKFIANNDSTTVDIGLKDLKTILDDVVVEDYVEYHTEEIFEDLFGGFAVYIDKFISDRVLSKIAEFNNKSMLAATEKKPYKPIVISEEGLELIELLSVDCSAADGTWHSDSEVKIDKLGYMVVDGKETDEFWDGRICCREKPLRLKIRNICGDETIVKLENGC